MSNERDELAAVVNGADWTSRSQTIADAVLAAGYRKPRQVTTIEELETLPRKSVILDVDGDVWERAGGRWRGTEGGRFASSLLVEFAPFTVLHVGGAK